MQVADSHQQNSASVARAFLAPAIPTAVPSSATVTANDDNAVVVLETNVDDMSPQIASYVTSMLLDQGAVDVWTTQIIMKRAALGIPYM